MILISEQLRGKSGGYILDIATTDGDFIQMLIKNLNDYEYAIGIDITEKDFNEGKKDFPENKISFLKMDSASLGFKNDFFDIVSMNAGLHHVDDIKNTLLEMKRVLKPGGFLIIKEMFQDNLTEKQFTDVMQHHWHSNIDRLHGIPHNPTLKRKDIISFVEDLGLSTLIYEDFVCNECDPEKDGKTKNIEKFLQEELSKIENHESHSEFKLEAENISTRINTIGFACATQLEVVGIK